MLPTGDAAVNGTWSLCRRGSETVGHRMTRVGKSSGGDGCEIFENTVETPLIPAVGRGLIWEAAS